MSIFIFFLCLFIFNSQITAGGGEHYHSNFADGLRALQEKIRYNFSSVDLLKQALTHASFSGENNRALAAAGVYAGETATAVQALRKEADISAADIAGAVEVIAGVHSCAVVGYRLGLPEIVRVSGKTNSSEPKVVCGAFRAVVGAVALDAGRIDRAAEVFWNVVDGNAAAVM